MYQLVKAPSPARSGVWKTVAPGTALLQGRLDCRTRRGD